MAIKLKYYIMKQDYKHHFKYYIPHHFIFLPLMTGAVIFGGYKSFEQKDNSLIWMLFTFLSFTVLYLAIMLRQHYALGNQNRIVRLEFYLRYFQLTGKKFDDALVTLSFSQIAALRFAYDDEFLLLTDKAINGNLSANEIKKLITKWKPDHMRV